MPPLYVIACATVCEELEPHLPEETILTRLDFGLHLHPDRLRERLQIEIDAVPAGHTILLGYGLCGGGLDGLCVGEHRVVAPRAHDCIALFLGSREAYETQSAIEAGTYYLTKGWLEAEEHGPVTEYERLVARHGPERGAYLARLAFANYTRLALIHTGNYQIEQYRDMARRLADIYELRFEELTGSNAWIRALAAGEWDERFLTFEPGDTITLSHFL
jgi:hypothetical protein